MNRDVYAVEKMCACLGVGRASYYRWLSQRDAAEQAARDKEATEEQLRQVFEDSKGTYGAPRVQQALAKQGVVLSVSTVSRIMARLGLRARNPVRYTATTDSTHANHIFENVLARQFHVLHPNRVWLSDITYLPTNRGWAYLTVVLDLADRMVVGWTVSGTLQAVDTSVAALQVALQRRSLTGPLLLHSDRGVQYACTEFTELVDTVSGLRQSMSRKGNCWDNAPMESFFKTLKTEWLKNNRFETMEQLKDALFEYIECWYNTHRMHSALNYLTPLETHNQLTHHVA